MVNQLPLNAYHPYQTPADPLVFFQASLVYQTLEPYVLRQRFGFHEGSRGTRPEKHHVGALDRDAAQSPTVLTVVRP